MKISKKYPKNIDNVGFLENIYLDLQLPILLLDYNMTIVFINNSFSNTFNFNQDKRQLSEFLKFIDEEHFNEKKIKDINKKFNELINKKIASFNIYFSINDYTCKISRGIIDEICLVEFFKESKTFSFNNDDDNSYNISIKRFDIAEQNANIGFWDFDIKTGVGWWSDNMYRLLGFEVSTIPPSFDEFLENIHPDDRKIVEDALMTMSSAELPIPSEYRTNPEKSFQRTISPSYLIEYDENKNPIKIYGTIADVSDKKKISDKIKFQNEMLNRVAQSIIVTDNQGKIVIWNKFAETLYGWKEEEVLGKFVIDVTVPEESKHESDMILNELLQGKSWSGKILLCGKNNNKFIGSVTDIPINDDNGNLIGVLGISYDISEQIKIEKALEETERLFSIAFKYSPIAMMIATFDAIFVQVNNKFCELTAYSVAELLGKKSPDLNIINLENRNQIISNLKNSPEKTYEGESIIQTKDKKE